MIFFLYDLIHQLKFIWITQPLAMLIITSYNWTTGGFVFFSFSCRSYLREKTNKIYILRPEIIKKKIVNHLLMPKWWKMVARRKVVVTNLKTASVWTLSTTNFSSASLYDKWLDSLRFCTRSKGGNCLPQISFSDTS